jgi:hypothetical protein
MTVPSPAEEGDNMVEIKPHGQIRYFVVRQKAWGGLMMTALRAAIQTIKCFAKGDAASEIRRADPHLF